MEAATMLGEFTRECLSRLVNRRITSRDVVDHLFHLLMVRGVAWAHAVRQRTGIHSRERWKWLGRMGVDALLIERGSPWENGYRESFNGTQRDELPNREVFSTR